MFLLAKNVVSICFVSSRNKNVILELNGDLIKLFLYNKSFNKFRFMVARNKKSPVGTGLFSVRNISISQRMLFTG